MDASGLVANGLQTAHFLSKTEVWSSPEKRALEHDSRLRIYALETVFRDIYALFRSPFVAQGFHF
jgi:hypothetical protein